MKVNPLLSHFGMRGRGGVGVQGRGKGEGRGGEGGGMGKRREGIGLGALGGGWEKKNGNRAQKPPLHTNKEHY